MKTAAFAITTILAGALIAGAASAQTPTAVSSDPSATTFTGWVKVSGGEFQIYERQQQVDTAFSRPCVSGVMPYDLQRSIGDVSGSKVEFTGRAVPWTARCDAPVIRYEGSTISNLCGGEFVVQADSLKVLRGG
ncbi:hypothetical protein BH09PSE1_BH09PSE1_10560 [soil metagenome]